MAPNAHQIREEVRREALQGFDRVGFARAGAAPHSDRLEEWLSRGYAGTMGWMARTRARRTDPGRVLKGTRTVIAAALHYGLSDERSIRSGVEAAQAAASGRGEISRYARGTDYHRVMEGRLQRLCEKLKESYPPEGFRWYVDTGPVLERAWAEAAGLGWIGKNACAIDPRRGSYFFIGVVLTTLDLPADEPATDHCGSCRLCIDARRCISYLTIEHRGSIPEELRPSLGGLVFGCDICQEVCPFNNRPDPPAGDRELAPRPENREPLLEELTRLSQEAFRARFPRSAVRRARAAGLLRNVLLAIGNSGRPEYRDLLDRLSTREDIRQDPVLSEALEWARKRLEQAL